MRVDNFKGKKHCVCCGRQFGYANIRKIFCSNICASKYYRANKTYDKNRPISLAYIPEHLIEKEQ